MRLQISGCNPDTNFHVVLQILDNIGGPDPVAGNFPLEVIPIIDFMDGERQAIQKLFAIKQSTS